MATPRSKQIARVDAPHLPIILAKTKRPAHQAGLFSSAPGAKDDLNPGPAESRLADFETAAGSLRSTQNDIQSQTGRPAAALTAFQRAVMLEPGAAVLDHQDNLTVVTGASFDPVANSGTGVREDVLHESIDESPQILPAHRHRQPAARRMHINRALLLIGEDLPERRPMPHHRTEISLLGTPLLRWLSGLLDHSVDGALEPADIFEKHEGRFLVIEGLCLEPKGSQRSP